MNNKYTHIFFDLDNTLWDFNKNSRQAIFKTFLKFNLNNLGVDFDKFFDTYSKNNDLLWEQYRRKEIHKDELTRQRFQKTFDDLTIDGIDAVQMNGYYLSEMSHQSVLVAGALDVLSLLKKRKYKLFVITNGFSEVQHKKLEISGLAPFFDRVFVSEEVKCPKPGREIFEYAITSTNAKKSKSLMVGDDLEVDIKGALNVGLTAVYLNTNVQEVDNGLKRNSQDNGFIQISRLSELLNLL